MKRAAWVISVTLILHGAACAEAQDGRLQAVRDAARASSDSDADSTSNGCGDNSILGSFLNGLFSVSDENGNSLGGALVGVTVLAPFYIPITILNDDYDFRLAFAPHPYANGYRGYQVLSPELASMFYGEAYDAVPRKSWAVRLALEDGNDFSGLNRFAGQLKLEHASRWGVVTNWNYFREQLPCGCIDETVIGDTNITFRFAQNEVASMYAGIGMRVLTDRHQTDFGVNFTYGGDWFPVRPIVVSGVIDAGTLGSAGVFHARGSVGAILSGWEVFTGYDFLRIGDTNLQGPLVGVRLWF